MANYKKFTIPVGVLSIIGSTIAMEGGWVNDKLDPGGETNKGITKATAVKYGYVAPMKELNTEIAQSIYYQGYFLEPKLTLIYPLDPVVTAEVFDTGVNMGTGTSIKFFQQAVNELSGSKLAVDGKLGEKAAAAFKDYQAKAGLVTACTTTLAKLDQLQEARYRAIVAKKPSQKRFLKGWLTHRIGNVDAKLCFANMSREA